MEKQPNILIVDDEKANIHIVTTLFHDSDDGKNYNLIGATSAKNALNIIEKVKIDLILLDIVMPDTDGYQLCEILKSKSSTKDIPVLFITANSNDESIIKAYSLGAVDYVTKPFRAVELISRVKVILKLQKTINQLEYFAYYDVLTDIYNRRKFFDLATTKFENEKQNLYAIMIDIDKFKNVNDTYGHPVGDKIIKEVATILKSNLHLGDVLGRIGGEEFGIVCNRSESQEVYNFIEDIRQKISKIEVQIDEKTTISCTISSGIAKNFDEVQTIDHLLHYADEALYDAKGGGRNKSIFRI